MPTTETENVPQAERAQLSPDREESLYPPRPEGKREQSISSEQQESWLAGRVASFKVMLRPFLALVLTLSGPLGQAGITALGAALFTAIFNGPLQEKQLDAFAVHWYSGIPVVDALFFDPRSAWWSWTLAIVCGLTIAFLVAVYAQARQNRFLVRLADLGGWAPILTNAYSMGLWLGLYRQDISLSIALQAALGLTFGLLTELGKEWKLWQLEQEKLDSEETRTEAELLVFLNDCLQSLDDDLFDLLAKSPLEGAIVQASDSAGKAIELLLQAFCKAKKVSQSAFGEKLFQHKTKHAVVSALETFRTRVEEHFAGLRVHSPQGRHDAVTASGIH